MKAYEKVLAARANDRPTAKTFISQMLDDFFELHGDRCFADDHAVIGGIGYLGEMALTAIGIEKGSDTKEKIMRNFGSAHPEGYRKALRLMQQAEKFNRPILCMVDTSGAYCGLGAEERGQGSAIAQNLVEMMDLSVPVICVVIGEGGSGGALALAVANEVWMLENAIYSVISPEGAASILWKDASEVQRASESLKLTAQDLYGLGVIEQIIPEYEGDFTRVFSELKQALIESFTALRDLGKETIQAKRYEKFRGIGRIEA